MADRPPYAALVERLPVRRDELALRGGRTACWTYGPPGAAHTLVFLHGLRGDHHGLEPIAAHLENLRVVVPDLPGFGASPPLPGPKDVVAHDVAGYAAWATELLHAVGGEPVLAGHSFGSVVAAATAVTVRPRRLVLVNPIATVPRHAMTRLTVGFHRLAAALPEDVGTALLRSPVVTRIASVAMATTSDPALRRWIHAEHGRYFAGFADRRVLLEAFHASIADDVAEFAPRITAPTLLVAAERDDIAPLPTQRELVNRFPDARLTVVPDVGHLAHYEAPGAVAQAIVAYLVPERGPEPPPERGEAGEGGAFV